MHKKYNISISLFPDQNMQMHQNTDMILHSNSQTSDDIKSTALKKTKIVYNVGLSECNRVKLHDYTFQGSNSSIFSLPNF